MISRGKEKKLFSEVEVEEKKRPAATEERKLKQERAKAKLKQKRGIYSFLSLSLLFQFFTLITRAVSAEETATAARRSAALDEPFFFCFLPPVFE